MAESTRYNLAEEMLKSYLKTGVKVLEVGCGGLEFISYLEKKYNVIGYCVDPYMPYGISSKIYSLKAEEIDRLKTNFQVIFTVMSLHHFQDPNAFMENVYKILDQNGILLIVDWMYGANTGVNERYFTIEEVISMAKKYKVVKTRRLAEMFAITFQKA